jgi:hypothetical protein
MTCARFTRSHARIAAGALALALLVPAGTALAHDHGRHGGHGHGRGRGYPGHGVPVHRVVAPRVPAAPAGFVVPPRLTPSLVYSSRPYLTGDFYYGPHRHRHVVYSFPVVVGGAVAWRPHVYCGGALVRDAWLPDDDGRLRFGLNLPGLSIAANVPLHD